MGSIAGPTCFKTNPLEIRQSPSQNELIIHISPNQTTNHWFLWFDLTYVISHTLSNPPQISNPKSKFQRKEFYWMDTSGWSAKAPKSLPFCSNKQCPFRTWKGRAFGQTGALSLTAFSQGNKHPIKYINLFIHSIAHYRDITEQNNIK